MKHFSILRKITHRRSSRLPLTLSERSDQAEENDVEPHLGNQSMNVQPNFLSSPTEQNPSQQPSYATNDVDEDQHVKNMPVNEEAAVVSKDRSVEATENPEGDRYTRRRTHTLTYNEDELSEIAMPSQGTETNGACNFTVLKVNKLLDDINKFTSKREKPKNKSAQLKSEEPTNGIYARKCGFITERPLKWAQGLEKLIEQADYRWDYLCDSDDEFQVCVVKIYQQSSTTKKIVIEIKISTGVILVSGNNYQEWMGQFFQSWHKMVESSLDEYAPPQPMLPPPSQNVPTTLPDDDSETQMSQLWEEQAKLKTSITTLGNSVEEMRSDLQGLSDSITSLKSTFHDLLAERDQAWDKKLTIFLDSAEEASKVMITQCKAELASDLEKQRKTMNEQEARLQSSLDQLKNSTVVNNATQNSTNLPKWTDLDHVSRYCKSANETAMNEIESLKETLHATKELTENPTNLPKWTDLDHVSRNCKEANEASMKEIESIKEALNETKDLFEERLRDLTLSGNHSAENTQTESSQVETPSTQKKIIILTDSNGKRLDKKKFCHPIPLSEVTWKICYTLAEINKELDSLRHTDFDMIVVSCGTNDTDNKDGVAVANELVAITKRIKQEHPHTKIVVGETTPRQYYRDNEIKLCNQALHEQLDQTPGLSIAVHSGLRDGNWTLYEDDKHIKRNKINIFAGNIKSAMREVRTGRRDQHSPFNRTPLSTNSTLPASSTQSINTSETLIPSSSISSYNTPHHNTHNDNYARGNRNSNNYNKLQNSNSSYHGASPLMSCSVAPTWSHYNNINNSNFNNNKNSNNINNISLPPQNHVRQQPFSTTATPWRPATPPTLPPIGERLTNIAENGGSPGQASTSIKETLIDKLGDVIKCLQAW